MRNARRNRILTLLMMTVWTMSLAALVWVMVAVSGGRRGWALALPVAAWLYLMWSNVHDTRAITRAERTLEADGVELPDEQPIPIRLAENRESLVVSIILLVLIALVFVAHFAGWLPDSRR